MSQLPKGWALATVGDLIELNPKNVATDVALVGFVPMPLMATKFREPIRYEEKIWGEVKKGYTHFADGDVLLAKITPCFENGKAGIAECLPGGLGAGSTEYFVCRPKKGIILPVYLLAFFKTQDFLRGGEVNMTGSVGHKRVPKDFLLNSEIPLAPLAEQKRIAEKLNTLLMRVDSARARLDRIPPLLKRFRQSVLAAATSGQLTEDWRQEQSAKASVQSGAPVHHRSDIEQPPPKGQVEAALSGWAYVRAADVCAKVQSGGTPKEGFADSGVPFLKVYNIVDQKVAFEYRPQYIDVAIHNGSMSKSQVRPGDVLMNIVGPPMGKVAVVPDSFNEWNINQAITLFRPSERVSTGWLYCVLCGGRNIADIVHETRGSAGQTNISLSQCRDFVFPVPPVAEQAEIVRRVNYLTALAEKLEVRYTTARAQVDKLTPALLAKAFRGELVPQDPSDESAEMLLKRIRITREEIPAAAKKGGKPRQRREAV